MRIKPEVRRVGTADPISSAKVTAQNWPSLTLCTTGTTDLEGVAELSCQGAPGMLRVRSERGSAIYETYSKVEQGAGAFDLENLRLRLSAGVPEGVLPYGDTFRTTVGSGVLILASGAVLVDGIIATWPNPTTLGGLGSGDRAVIAEAVGDTVTLNDVTYGYSQAHTGRKVPLWRYTVNSGAVVPGSVQPIYKMAGRKGNSARAAVMAIAQLGSGTSTNTSGEPSALSLTLPLAPGVTYQILAEANLLTWATDGAVAVEIDGALGPYVSAIGDVTQTVVASQSATKTGGSCLVRMFVRSDTTAANWAHLATYGPVIGGLPLSHPSQMAVTSTGKVYVADNGNDRVLRLNPDGSVDAVHPGTFSRPLGVAVDSADNVYIGEQVAGNGVIKKFTAGFALAWTATLGVIPRALAIDETFGYVLATTSANTIQRYLLTTGAFYDTVGTTGSGVGELNVPWGIAVHNTTIMVIDSNNGRIQRFGAHTHPPIRETIMWPIAFGARGAALDSSARLWVAYPGYNDLDRYVVDYGTPGGLSEVTFITQPSPEGVAVAPDGTIWTNDTASNTLDKWAFQTSVFSWKLGYLTAIAIPR